MTRLSLDCKALESLSEGGDIVARDRREQKTIEMLKDKSIPTDDIIRYVKGECRDIPFSPQTLGMLFERIAGVEYDEDDPMSCFSAEISIDTLANIHPSFRSTNGCQWARSDNSYLGKKYIIVREHQGGRVCSVKLDGANNKSIKRNRGIRKDILDAISIIAAVTLPRRSAGANAAKPHQHQ